MTTLEVSNIQPLLNAWNELDARRKYLFMLYELEKISKDAFDEELRFMASQYRQLSKEIDKAVCMIVEKGPN